MAAINNIYTKNYTIAYHDQNVRGNLKESILLNHLEDIASLSAESLNFGSTFALSHNYAWFLLKYRIEFYKEIKEYASIRIETEPRGVSKLYAFRDFSFYSQENELLGKATSTWALVDMDTRRIISAQKSLPFISPFEKREDDLIYDKIEAIENINYTKEFNVRFDDIDTNHHVNNSNYIIWALESLPYEFRLHHTPKIINIRYKKEISLGGKILSEAQHKGEYSLHTIRDASSQEELCSLKMEWS